MRFKNEDAAKLWREGLENNRDPYGAEIYRYAERWADMMEERLCTPGAVVATIARQTGHDADTEGITGFMYGAAVSILSQAWNHGEELRCWHNLDTQIGTEGEDANETGGVLNPALLSIATKK